MSDVTHRPEGLDDFTGFFKEMSARRHGDAFGMFCVR